MKIHPCLGYVGRFTASLIAFLSVTLLLSACSDASKVTDTAPRVDSKKTKTDLNELPVQSTHNWVIQTSIRVDYQGGVVVMEFRDPEQSADACKKAGYNPETVTDDKGNITQF